MVFLKDNFVSSINLKISDSDHTKLAFKQLVKNSLQNLNYQKQIQLYLDYISFNVISQKKHNLIKKSCKKSNNSKCVNKKLKSIKYFGTIFANSQLFHNHRMSLTEL